MAIRKHEPGRIDEIKPSLEKELAGQFGEAPMIAPMNALLWDFA